MKNFEKWLILFALLECFCLVLPSEVGKIQLKSNKTDEGTTTAIPKHNETAFSTISASSTSSTTTSPVSSKATTQRLDDKSIEKSSTTPSGGLYYTSKSPESSVSTNVQNSSATTAVPQTVSSSTEYHRWDSLSFLGGCLFTMCCISVGLLVWKIYSARLERNYLTI